MPLPGEREAAVSDMRLSSGNPVHAMPRRSLPVVPTFLGLRIVTRVEWTRGTCPRTMARVLDALRMFRPETAW